MATAIKPTPQLRDLYREPERMSERQEMIRLDRNERLSAFPASVFADMMRSITAETISTYPDPTPLYSRLARLSGLPEDCFFATNGSDAALRMILQAFLSPGETLVLSSPTYAMLPVYGRIFGANVVEVPYDEQVRLDTARLGQLIDSHPRVVAIPNPDQPTGTTLAPGALRELIARAEAAGVLFVIDEAYFPFYPHSVISWVREFCNLLVTRSYSKAWGLAGLRLGVLAGSPDLVNHASRVRGLHEVNTFAAHFGCYLMDHPEVMDAYVAEVAAGREILREGARALGLGFPECQTNFQLMRCDGVDTARLAASMKRRGYLIKGGYKVAPLRDCIRLTVGPPALMDRFLGDLRLSLEEQNVTKS
ncbi:MAG: histidinol-phosphate aminotransferase family protein [Verrucomicrobia bacterium]|nr:histidinol-phosphate aminotransferase family protein [Verrucomicrobiota bacterium]